MLSASNSYWRAISSSSWRRSGQRNCAASSRSRLASHRWLCARMALGESDIERTFLECTSHTKRGAELDQGNGRVGVTGKRPVHPICHWQRPTTRPPLGYDLGPQGCWCSSAYLTRSSRRSMLGSVLAL